MKYTKNIGPELRSRIDELSDDSRPKHLQDEVAIVEVMLQEAVAKFSHYHAIVPTDEDSKRLREGGVQLTTGYFLSILKDYKALLLDQQKLIAGPIAQQDNSVGILSQTALHVEKVLLTYGQELGVDSRVVASEIAQAIGENVLLPQGTDITPDQDVIEMDATIPYYDAGSNGHNSNGHNSNGTA